MGRKGGGEREIRGGVVEGKGGRESMRGREARGENKRFIIGIVITLRVAWWVPRFSVCTSTTGTSRMGRRPPRPPMIPLLIKVDRR